MANTTVAPYGASAANDSAFVLSCVCGDNLEDTYRTIVDRTGSYELLEATVGGSYPCKTHMDNVLYLPARYHADRERDFYRQWVADTCDGAVRLSSGWACMDCGDTDIDPVTHCCYE